MDKKVIALVIVLVLVMGTAVLIGFTNSASTGYGIFDTVAKIFNLGKGKPPKVTSNASCYVVPNPANINSPTIIGGSGFPASRTGGYSITGSGGTAMGFLVFDKTGSFSTQSQAVWLGNNNVYVASSTKPQVTATCTFQVI